MTRPHVPPLPVSFRGTEASGWCDGARVHQYEQGTMQNFVYTISIPENGTFWLVDPHREWEKCEEDAERAGLRIAGALLTHSHHDHIAGLPSLLRRYPELKVIAGAGDAFRLEKLEAEFPRARFHYLDRDQEIDLGGLNGQYLLSAIHSPGHSVGEFCYLLGNESPPLLLTGDVLFVRQCGRTDFETGSDRELFATLARIKSLPPETVVLPGHHYTEECASTLAVELRENAPLRAGTWEELRDLP